MTVRNVFGDEVPELGGDEWYVPPEEREAEDPDPLTPGATALGPDNDGVDTGDDLDE